MKPKLNKSIYFSLFVAIFCFVVGLITSKTNEAVGMLNYALSGLNVSIVFGHLGVWYSATEQYNLTNKGEKDEL